jgi:RNA-directed DNA polymerase
VIADMAQDTPQERVRVLQRKLYRSAKEAPKRRYGILFDKVCAWDTLWTAWQQVRGNQGAPGIDRQSIEDIEEYGETFFLGELQQELREGRYWPRPVRRVWIPKPDGRKRGLGIPVVKDRIVQAAVKLVIEPLFEADFQDFSYGFRPKRSAHGAIREIRRHAINGHWQVIDADLKSYFDTIPHDNLMKVVAQRVSDPRILRLIRAWLKAGVMEDGKWQAAETGSPQGGVISPLLANVYLNILDRLWRRRGLDGPGHEARLVRYADDLVILCRRKPEVYMDHLRAIVGRLGLTLNEEKTRIVNAWEGFDFLGMHFLVKRSRRGKPWCYFWPSQRSMKRIRQRIRDVVGSNTLLALEDIIEWLNPVLRGWGQYFRVGNAAEHFARVDLYARRRIASWLQHKRHRRSRHGYGHYRADFYKKIGLYQLSGTISHLPL